MDYRPGVRARQHAYALTESWDCTNWLSSVGLRGPEALQHDQHN